MRTDSHGDADRAQPQRPQGHERKQAGSAIERAGEALVGLAVVADRGVGQRALELVLDMGDVGVRSSLAGAGRGQAHEDAARGAGALGKQAGLLERVL